MLQERTRSSSGRIKTIPSISRPANPYDNVGCETCLITLQQAEISADTYRELKQLCRHIESFIEQYSNHLGLLSALGDRPPEEFEQTVAPRRASGVATMRWFQSADDTESRRGRRVKKIVESTGLCYFRISPEGFIPMPLWSHRSSVYCFYTTDISPRRRCNAGGPSGSSQ